MLQLACIFLELLSLFRQFKTDMEMVIVFGRVLASIPEDLL